MYKSEIEKTNVNGQIPFLPCMELALILSYGIPLLLPLHPLVILIWYGSPGFQQESNTIPKKHPVDPCQLIISNPWINSSHLSWIWLFNIIQCHLSWPSTSQVKLWIWIPSGFSSPLGNTWICSKSSIRDQSFDLRRDRRFLGTRATGFSESDRPRSSTRKT